MEHEEMTATVIRVTESATMLGAVLIIGEIARPMHRPAKTVLKLYGPLAARWKNELRPGDVIHCQGHFSMARAPIDSARSAHVFIAETLAILNRSVESLPVESRPEPVPIREPPPEEERLSSAAKLSAALRFFEPVNPRRAVRDVTAPSS